MAVAEVDYLNGGKSGMKLVSLGTKTTSDTNTFELSDSIYNYPAVMLCMKVGGHKNKIVSTIAPTSLISSTYEVDNSLTSDSSEYYCLCEVIFTDGNHAKLSRILQSNYTFSSLEVFGVM